MAIEIERTLVLSTGHVTKETGQLLDSPEGKDLWNLAWEYGWIFYVPPDGEAAIELPDEILKALKLAHAHGCKWVRYDSDGEQLSELPFYVW